MAGCNVTLVGVPLERQSVGDALEVEIDVKSAATGLPVDPTAVGFEYRVGADGPVVDMSSALVNLGVGKRSLELVFDRAGTWYLRAAATGSYIGAEESQVVVIPSAF